MTFAPVAEIPSHVPEDRIFRFDFFDDPLLGDDLQVAYMQLQEDAPDVFYSPLNGGHWMVTRMADIQTIMTKPQIFSSANAPIRPDQPRIPLAPQDMDAPDHMRHRLLLLNFMAPREIRKLEPKIREMIVQLIDDLQDRTSCEFKAEVAVPMPVKMFMTMMQWDLSRYREFVHWVDTIMGAKDPGESGASYMAMNQYISEMIDARLAKPGEDPVSLLLRSEINGVPLSRERVHEMCHLLFLAGLDTVTAAMTFIMNHLASHPELQHRLRDHPEQIDGAIEEFMRRFSFVNTTRRVTQDTELSGAKLKAGDRVVCSLAAASNDSRSFACPAQVDIDRPRPNHVAFNTGPHSCIGAPLARLELRIFLQEWLQRMPDVRHAPGFVPEFRGGSTMSIERLDLEWSWYRRNAALPEPHRPLRLDTAAKVRC